MCECTYLAYTTVIGLYTWTVYSGPSLKGHSLERTPLNKGRKFLAAGTGNACDAPSHQRTPL